MEESVLKIEKIVFGGNGLARTEAGVTFVPFTLPGETVRAIPRRKHKDYVEADPIEIMEPSVDRVPPDCSYFGRCGGCRLSHASYPAQLKIKQDVLIETLQRAKLEFPQVEVVSGAPFEYRHRARLKYNSRTGSVGFFESDSHRIVDIKQCLCLTPALNKLLARLRVALAACPVERLSEIECYENDRGETALYFDAEIPPPLRNSLRNGMQLFTPRDKDSSLFNVRFRDQEFPMRPDVFLQINPGLWNPMMQEIESHYAGDNERSIVELYSGAGFFTVSLSKQVKKIWACEDNERSVYYAQQLKLSNVEWAHRKAEDFEFPAGATALVVDPPRAGLHTNVVQRALRHPLDKISYISCDAASLARDLKALAPAYQIKRVVLLDLFAQTHHFETIVLLHRRS